MEIHKYIDPKRRFLILEGIYEARIIDVKETEWVMKHAKIKGMEFSFEVAYNVTDGNTDFKGCIALRKCTPSISPRSFLEKIIRGALGRQFTNEELAQINIVADIRKFLLGRPIVIVVENFYSILYKDMYYNVSFFARSKYWEAEKNKENAIVLLGDTVPTSEPSANAIMYKDMADSLVGQKQEDGVVPVEEPEGGKTLV